MTAHSIATQFPGHGGDHRSLTSQRNIALMKVLVLSCVWLILFTCYPWVFVQKGTGRRRSNGAGIKCLYGICITTYACVTAIW